MGKSVIPLIAGFLQYDEKKLIKGVILNRTSKMFFDTIAPLIEEELEIKALGCIPNEKELTIKALCTAKLEGKTGVEMEALTGVSVALLTIYDMCKAIDKRMEIGEIHLDAKSGGKSGEFVR